MRGELAVLRQRMEPWKGDRPWRELEEALAVLPRTVRSR